MGFFFIRNVNIYKKKNRIRFWGWTLHQNFILWIVRVSLKNMMLLFKDWYMLCKNWNNWRHLRNITYFENWTTPNRYETYPDSNVGKLKYLYNNFTKIVRYLVVIWYENNKTIIIIKWFLIAKKETILVFNLFAI